MKTWLTALSLGVFSLAALAQESLHNGNDLLVRRGEYVAQMGDCIACHTREGGQPFAGGLPIATAIGIIYSTNITPDNEYGIGSYSFEEFDQAVRYGIRKDGATLYPAMPFPSYSVVTQSDTRALYAYMMNRVRPVAQANRENDISWPLSWRWPLAIWRGVFAPDVRAFTAQPDEAPALARGRYLVEGLGHCGACHTPRGFAMQEKALNDSEGTLWLSGGAPVNGWVAVNLRGDNITGLGRMSQSELVQLLRTGRNDRTAVFGGMSDVVEHSLQHLTHDDAVAVARYLKSLKPADAADPPFTPDSATARALWRGDDAMPGAAVYVDNCAGCHRTDGSGYRRFFPELRGNPVVLSKDATSIIHIVLTGYTLPGVNAAPSAITMPPFGWRLSDRQVADVINFIRTSWGNRAPEIDADDVKSVREDKSVILDSRLRGSPDLEKLPKPQP